MSNNTEIYVYITHKQRKNLNKFFINFFLPELMKKIKEKDETENSRKTISLTHRITGSAKYNLITFSNEKFNAGFDIDVDLHVFPKKKEKLTEEKSYQKVWNSMQEIKNECNFNEWKNKINFEDELIKKLKINQNTNFELKISEGNKVFTIKVLYCNECKGSCQEGCNNKKIFISLDLLLLDPKEKNKYLTKNDKGIIVSEILFDYEQKNDETWKAMSEIRKDKGKYGWKYFRETYLKFKNKQEKKKSFQLRKEVVNNINQQKNKNQS